MQKQTLLCVDDESDNLDALARIFRTKYNVLRALSGPEGLELLKETKDPVSVIITDQRMPQMSGVEFLEKSLSISSESIRILLTGYTDLESVVAAINTGQIYRYLTKPWDPRELLHTVDRAVERFLMAREIKEKNAALSQALSDLKVLDQAKSQFMMLVNHELKTPLTTIINYVELLRESSLTEEQSLGVQRISRGAERLQDLISDVLLIVSADMKTLKLSQQKFNAESLKIDPKPEAERAMLKKGQTIAKQLLAKTYLGDPGLLSQVLIRLVHNAIKFGKENSTIEVTTQLVSPHRVQVSVKNEGPSIPDAVREKVLKPFFIDEDIMNHSSGSGLGLTVCQSILRLHGSKLDLANSSTGVIASFEMPCL